MWNDLYLIGVMCVVCFSCGLPVVHDWVLKAQSKSWGNTKLIIA